MLCRHQSYRSANLARHIAAMGCLAIMVMTASLNAAIRRVDAANVNGTGPGDAIDWSNAYEFLEDALAAAGTNDVIWVADGTYVPGSVRTASFILKENVTVLGGFAGDETMEDQRDPSSNITILSGEIGSAGPSDNCYHVVIADTITSSADHIHLDGFTIQRGHASGLMDEERRGGGILCKNGGNARLNNCIIRDNHALWGGGGAAAWQSGPVFTNCTFQDNSAAAVSSGGSNLDLAGGGLLVANNAEDVAPLLTVVVSNCTFVGNEVLEGYGGGGLAVIGWNLEPGLSAGQSRESRCRKFAVQWQRGERHPGRWLHGGWQRHRHRSGWCC